MPIEVGNFSTQVTVLSGDMPLTPAQVEQLVQLILKRVAQQQRDDEQTRAAVEIRNQARR